jgi:acetyltransferase-like isoleucine patch superfamily enzyme
MVSTSPVFYSAKNNLNASFNIEEFEEFDKTIIGNDVWIGINAFIKGGISIGDGAVIGAYSVVTRDVEPYSIVAGNPAKLIRKRFNDSEVEKLLKVKWWNDDEINIRKKARHFKDILDFCEHY